MSVAVRADSARERNNRALAMREERRIPMRSRGCGSLENGIPTRDNKEGRSRPASAEASLPKAGLRRDPAFDATADRARVYNTKPKDGVGIRTRLGGMDGRW